MSDALEEVARLYQRRAPSARAGLANRATLSLFGDIMSAIMARMVRTTIMADPALIDELRAIAKEEQISLGEAIRQGLEWRANTRRRIPSFVKHRSASAEPASDDGASRDEELIIEWVKDRDARRDDARL